MLSEIFQVIMVMHQQLADLHKRPSDYEDFAKEYGFDLKDRKRTSFIIAEHQTIAETFIERMAQVLRDPVSLPAILREAKISERPLFAELTLTITDVRRLLAIERQILMEIITIPLMVLTEEKIKEKLGGSIDPKQKKGLISSVHQRGVDYLYKVQEGEK